mmetsp:Transcript_30910/g.99923  ORF Transcript_30910/g.99923 Transcript_30910/m.99923 type:complete len:240 (+) Transcript_30910:2-721(+)
MSGQPTHSTVRPATAGSSGIGSQLQRAKHARMRAEQNRQLLQNRINRLIVEEERAMKRIAETRQRVKEIWELKSRNTLGKEAHRDVEEHIESEQVAQRQLLQQVRDERRRNVAHSRVAVEQQRREEAAALKQLKGEQEDAVTAQRNEDHARCVARKQLVLEQQRAAQERKARERQTALAKIREQREAKRQEEAFATSLQLQKLSMLAEEERRLSGSLQCWRQEQQQVLRQLEGVMVRET